MNRKRDANQGALFNGYDGLVSLTKPDWPKDFLGSEGALTAAAKRPFDAYVLNAGADCVYDVAECALLCAAERGSPVRIGIIGEPSSVGPVLDRIRSDAAGLGISYLFSLDVAS